MEFLKKNKLLIILSITALVVAIIAFIVISLLSQPYIKNSSNFLSSAPAEDISDLENRLKVFFSEYHNTSDVKDLYIRRDSYYETHPSGTTTTSHFLLDTNSLKQTLSVEFSWPTDENTSENIIISCPAISDLKYPDSDCVSDYNSSALIKAEEANPLSTILPIEVGHSVNRKYELRYSIYGEFDDNYNFTVYILDYEGTNEAAAYDAIREAGFDPKDYKIVYKPSSR